MNWRRGLPEPQTTKGVPFSERRERDWGLWVLGVRLPRMDGGDWARTSESAAALRDRIRRTTDKALEGL